MHVLQQHTEIKLLGLLMPVVALAEVVLAEAEEAEAQEDLEIPLVHQAVVMLLLL
jgi:hypothetical protein